MTTTKQVKANRSNVLKGGVKTEQGKQVSSKNALKHGVLSAQVLEQENNEYKDLMDELTDDYQPTTTIKKALTERLALHIIQLQRLNQASNEFWQSCIEPDIRKESEDIFDFTKGKLIQAGYKPTITSEKVEALLTIYHRYQTRLENQMIKLDEVLRR